MRYLLLLICCVISSGALASDLDNVVKIDSGYVVGSGAAVRVYKGIPFAAPPVGELRWQPPHPVKAWDSIRVSKTFSLSCAQPPVAVPRDRIGEDCLTINVWTPAHRVNARLPVLVSIFGGGFQAGTSALALYDAERLASRGLVVVTFNYRLGVFGFLAHPELSKESPQGISGNYALLDMVAALKWVRRNISAFGGDPANVTIWGESAGGSAVGLLLTVPQAAGLFQRAIANSPWTLQYPISRLRESRPGRASAEDRGARLGSLSSLRAKSVDELLQSTAASASPSGGEALGDGFRDAFRPIVDGAVVPDDPAVLLAKGAFHHVALIAGTNADEGVFFAPRTVTTREQADAWLRDQFGADAASQLSSPYGLQADVPVPVALNRLVGDALIGMGARAMLRAAALHNRNVYQYEFTRVSGVAKRLGMNAYHGADLSYTWGTLPESVLSTMIPTVGVRPGDYDAIDERLSQAMSGAIVQFARTGVPNGKGLPHWAPYGERENYLEYGDAIVEKQKLRSRYLDALDAIFASKRGEPSAQPADVK
jgi:para-nitrobenzyl esterase